MAPADLLHHVVRSVLNGRSPSGLVINFALNFSPVLLWLTLFKNAALIPVDWRPAINVSWLPLADDTCFNTHRGSAYLFYLVVVVFVVLPIARLCFDFPLPSCRKDSAPSPSPPPQSGLLFLSLLLLAWPVLNTLNFLAATFQNYLLDLLSYTSYVLLHLIVPIVTSVYLYVFHPPGVLASYAWSLGSQNILGLSTHILLPSSPPWFIHLNGLNATADYSTMGYAAGLVRIDSSLGTHLATNGFHKSPIVFGALPSLHSAMAVLSCMYISWFTTSKFLVVLSFTFVMVQWWATIYLDHHWRLDLFAGMCYATLAFLTFRSFNPQRFNTTHIYTSTAIPTPAGASTHSNTHPSCTSVENRDLELDSDEFDLDCDLELQSFSKAIPTSPKKPTDNINGEAPDHYQCQLEDEEHKLDYRYCEYEDSNSSNSSSSSSSSEISSATASSNASVSLLVQEDRPFGLRLFAGTPLEFLFV